MRSNDPLDNLLPQVTAWRQHLHQHPELGYEVHETAGRWIARRHGCIAYC